MFLISDLQKVSRHLNWFKNRAENDVVSFKRSSVGWFFFQIWNKSNDLNASMAYVYKYDAVIEEMQL